MRELNPGAYGFNIHLGALDTALRAALPGKVIGASTYGPSRPISIFVDDSASGADETAALANAAAHDPVFLTVDKTAITADGVDAATVTVRAPKPGAAAVTLLVNGSPVPVTLANGVGAVEVASLDPDTITVSVQDGDNRSTDTITILAR